MDLLVGKGEEESSNPLNKPAYGGQTRNLTPRQIYISISFSASVSPTCPGN